MKTIENFDCVEMKRRAALRIHERLAGLTLEEQVEYWRRRSEEFRRISTRSGLGAADQPVEPV
ncbi:MAG TPA: hypothetical protein VM285_02810 [Polyangia bacterium]|nr:hypothetical protein [Polyangia bacterium]